MVSYAHAWETWEVHDRTEYFDGINIFQEALNMVFKLRNAI